MIFNLIEIEYKQFDLVYNTAYQWSSASIDSSVRIRISKVREEFIIIIIIDVNRYSNLLILALVCRSISSKL